MHGGSVPSTVILNFTLSSHPPAFLDMCPQEEILPYINSYAYLTLYMENSNSNSVVFGEVSTRFLE
jgi:hypothetical protein